MLNTFTRRIAVSLLFSGLLASCKTLKVSVKTAPYPSSREVIKATPKSNDIPASKQADQVIQTARSYTGTPYRWGGNTKSGMDCSGLVCQSYGSVGIQLPRMAGDQAKLGKAVTIKNIMPGDMVFFKAYQSGNKNITHVGIITEVGKGEAKFIHASSSRGVMESNLFSTYWKPLIVKIIRVI